MAKPELGTKRVCQHCGAKFYDLTRDPIVCPKCATVFVVPPVVTRGRSGPAAAAVRPAVVEEEEVETTPAGAEAEFVPLEEAEATDDAKVVTDDAEVDEEVAAEDDAFLEEAEEGEDDVADLIDGDIEDDEEA